MWSTTPGGLDTGTDVAVAAVAPASVCEGGGGVEWNAGEGRVAKRKEEKATLKAELEESSQELFEEVCMCFLLLAPLPAFTFLPPWALC